jgi:hypothetical protein
MEHIAGNQSEISCVRGAYSTFCFRPMKCSYGKYCVEDRLLKYCMAPRFIVRWNSLSEKVCKFVSAELFQRISAIKKAGYMTY